MGILSWIIMGLIVGVLAIGGAILLLVFYRIIKK